jgi:hypothetical protein
MRFPLFISPIHSISILCIRKSSPYFPGISPNTPAPPRHSKKPKKNISQFYFHSNRPKTKKFLNFQTEKKKKSFSQLLQIFISFFISFLAEKNEAKKKIKNFVI